MSEIPSDLKYTESHEWVRLEGGDEVTIGITDHAQELLGDLVFVELPEVGTEVEAKTEFGVVESVKAASDVYSPVSGTVVAVNEALEDAPDLINTDSFHEGWLIRVQLSDPVQLDKLMDADAYEQVAADE